MKFATQYAKKYVIIFALNLLIDIAAVIGVIIFLVVKNEPTAAIIFAVLGLAIIPCSAFLLLFFRDPDRSSDIETPPANQMLAASDGVVTDITKVNDPRVGGEALKVSVFMSVFNVHVNRVPCAVKVQNIEVKPGEYLDARNLESSKRNKSCDLTLSVIEQSGVKLPETIVVRQIAGLVAKQIICNPPIGQEFKSGERFGMVRFGSRTEIIVPAYPEPKIEVEVGQKVQTGETVLLSY